jgi:dipeptidyl aminopeptidase/acylaminoacyl peptidase
VGQSGIWFGYDDLSTPREARHLGRDGQVVRAGHFNDTALESITFGVTEERTVIGGGGDETRAFILYPPGFDRSRRWPLVHLIHGGPHGVFGDQFHPRWCAQAFAGAGYVVALVNFHGSSSFGTAYRESILGAWSELPCADVEAVTDALLADGFIDPSRMAITGGSYGGYLTAWIATQTDRYACGIVHAGVYDLESMYASDLTSGLETAAGGAPWDAPEVLARHSPSSHAARITTPLLVIHGERDFRVPYTQALQLYATLKARGVSARLALYPDENHWILRPHTSLHWYEEVFAWLQRHLGATTK